ncbi:MAG TPA: cytochrome c3 family protein [Vicinamibacterales bacterium]|nr:cytochrome c3 family protein [Vicinamibacterales bacterium]
MSQVFPKSANAWSKASIIALVFVLLGLGWLVLTIQRSDYVTAANQFIEQPVQFSHQHHAGGIGIECRYCHTSVEVSPSAGIPPTKTCINCHSQIWSTSPYLEPVRASFRDDRPLNWIRVHDLPDFVYFNHSIHVRKGVGCETCHGRVDRMPLMVQTKSLQMEWCLDCHRDPAKYVRPRDQITTMGYVPAVAQAELGAQLVRDYKIASKESLTNCSVCHR